MSLDPMLLEILACPEDKGPLLYFADEGRLYNPRLHRSYEVRDDIPVMLIDEAVTVDDAEHERLVRKAEAEHVPHTLSTGAGASNGIDGASTGGGASNGVDGAATAAGAAGQVGEGPPSTAAGGDPSPGASPGGGR